MKKEDRLPRRSQPKLRQPPNAKDYDPGRLPGSKGGRPSAIVAKERSTLLRNIAAEVFMEFGFEGAKLGEIARRAGASKETIYTQYANKEALFQAVMTDFVKVAFEPFEFLAADDSRPLAESLTGLAFELLSHLLLEHSRLLAHVVYAESHRFPELGRTFWLSTHQRGQFALAEYLRGQIRRGRLTGDNPDVMARQFFELVTSEVILKGLLNIQQVMTATQKRTQATSAVNMFLRAYGK